MEEHILTNEKALEYILAGKSLFTVSNSKSGNRFTYKIKKHKTTPNLFFVSVLTGSNNTSDYTYIGKVSNNQFSLTPKSRFKSDATSVVVFNWILTHLKNNTLPSFINFFHHGKCGHCQKTLTTPESIQSGYGSVCFKKLKISGNIF